MTDTLREGPELDALIATEVMGEPVIEWGHDTPCPICRRVMRYCSDRARCSLCGEWRYGPYREYSADLAEAWPVVGRVCERLDCWFVLAYSPNLCQVGFAPFGWATATEPALAICLAALEAVRRTG